MTWKQIAFEDQFMFISSWVFSMSGKEKKQKIIPLTQRQTVWEKRWWKKYLKKCATNSFGNGNADYESNP